MRLEALTKTYPDGTEAVRGIDLEAEDGQLVVLLGPSGCGKTTTLRMIAGLETVTSGCILLDGRDVTHDAASERDVGFVFQFYALYPHMTVRENIAFPLDNTGVARPERDRRVTETADRLGIASLLDRYPGQLSGGDQQRVSLARAMVRRPGIYLMDEPLGQLDAAIRLDLREAIRSQQIDSGITTVYVTHDQEEALSLADLVVVMNAGRIEQAGTPDEVYDRPASLFVADFVGSPGMNTIAGETVGQDNSVVFRSGELAYPLASAADPARAVTLGVRPEFVRVVDDGPIPAEVRVVEYFGDHHVLHLDTAAGPVTARSDRTRHPGDTVTLDFDPDHVRLFDPDTGACLP